MQYSLFRETPAKPFLKWAGGKRGIVGKLLRRLPAARDGYCEPFFGGGALYFALRPDDAFLSDANPRLMSCYQAVRDDAAGVTAILLSLIEAHDQERYLACRTRFNSGEAPRVEQAALMIYLNGGGYNGLYRENAAGDFNVAAGLDVRWPSPETIAAAGKALRNAQIDSRSFEDVAIRSGRFYYLDPPYHGNFSAYTAHGFRLDDHERLADFCESIDDAGGFFLLSNSDTPVVRDLYRGFSIETILAPRHISQSTGDRGPVAEVLIRNYV